MMPDILITGTGSYVPERVLTNHDLEAMVDTSDEWISMRTGIRERHVADCDTTVTMAVKASRAALRAAGRRASEIDLVVVGTVTPEMVFPSTACYVQSSVGVRKGAPAFDVSAACSGFLYALDVAEKYVRGGAAERALVVGVDQFSRIIDWKDRATCVLFGDGAGAVVLEARRRRGGRKRGILSSCIHSDGNRWELLYVPGSIPPSPFEKKEKTPPHLRMQGNETFRIAVRTMEDAIREALEMAGMDVSDVSLIIPHQANRRIIKAALERTGLNGDRAYLNMDRYGNTSAASIPIALDEAVRAGRVKKDDVIVFAAFGGGLTWASAVMRW